MRWNRIAFLCRYSNQRLDIFLGRDLVAKPLTTWESHCFQAALARHLKNEYPDDTSTSND